MGQDGSGQSFMLILVGSGWVALVVVRVGSRKLDPRPILSEQKNPATLSCMLTHYVMPRNIVKFLQKWDGFNF